MGVWPGMWYALGCGGGLIFAGLLVARKLRQQDSFVPMDFYESRYGSNKWVRLWAWISNVPSLLGIFIAQLLACGSILSGFGLEERHIEEICTQTDNKNNPVKLSQENLVEILALKLAPDSFKRFVEMYFKK